MESSGFFSGLRKVEHPEAARAVRVEVPASDVEQAAHRWAKDNIGTVTLHELPDDVDVKEARRQASAVSKVDLKRFGVHDRHVRAEIGLWRIPGEEFTPAPRLRIEVAKGPRRNRRTKTQPAAKPGADATAELKRVEQLTAVEAVQQYPDLRQGDEGFV